jgi:hypothetical protein
MTKENKIDIWAGVIILFYGAGWFFGSFTMPTSIKKGELGPAFMPRLMGGIIIILSVLLIAFTVQKIKSAKTAGSGAASEEEAKPKQDYKAVVETFALLIFYMLALQPLGFIVTSMIYLFLQMLVIANQPTGKQIILYAFLSIIVPIVVNFIFVKFFVLLLPPGVLGFLG